MKLLLVGFGNVGRALVELLVQDRRGLQIVGLFTKTRGALYCAQGLDGKALSALPPGEPLSNHPRLAAFATGRSIAEILAEASVDVLVDASPTILPDAGPALGWCRQALEREIHVVLANKAPLIADAASLQESAAKSGARLLFEATVMAGTPVIQLARHGLRAERVSEVQGILNGTSNYILSRMDEGRRFEDALAEAQELGYAEADPSADIDGWDTAVKLVILSQVLFDRPIALHQVARQSLRKITSADIQKAHAQQRRWKYVGSLDESGACVAPMALPQTHPLSQVAGAQNAITLQGKTLGSVTLQGPGAGGKETALGILNDLLELQGMA
ncbi:MAG: homoserine dehydrogenase [Chloroflexi bacterium]|nr:homoserine dehydrogenase [Chloroflexota bacterium]